MANYSDLFPRGSAGATIASIQSVSLTGSAATRSSAITTVDLTKSIIISNGNTTSGSNLEDTEVQRMVSFASGTSLQDQGSTSGNASITSNYMIVEFSTGISSLQTFTVTLSTATSATTNQAVTAVDTSKSILIYTGVHSTVATLGSISAALELTSSTNVSCTRIGDSIASECGFILVEFE
jgi:hypothetical protein